MGTLTSLALAPFAAFFRVSYANPVIAIAVSLLAGILAYATGHEDWMAILVSFGAYMLTWWDESQHPPEAAPHSDAD